METNFTGSYCPSTAQFCNVIQWRVMLTNEQLKKRITTLSLARDEYRKQDKTLFIVVGSFLVKNVLCL